MRFKGKLTLNRNHIVKRLQFISNCFRTFLRHCSRSEPCLRVVGIMLTLLKVSKSFVNSLKVQLGLPKAVRSFVRSFQCSPCRIWKLIFIINFAGFCVRVNVDAYSWSFLFFSLFWLSTKPHCSMRGKHN